VSGTSSTTSQPKLKRGLSWFVVALGFLLGLFVLARFGMSWVPFGDHEPGWLLRWLTFVGIGLLGLGLLSGSTAAVRNPKRAGVIFLLFLPVTTFCLAYPESGFLVWHPDGSGWFETPLPLTAVGLTALFYVPFVPLLFLRHHRKQSVIGLAVAVLLVTAVFVSSRWTSVLLPPLAGFSAPFLLFGLFWLGTHKLGWPTPLQPRPRTMSRRVVALAITCGLVFCLDIMMTFGLSALGSSLFSGDCSGKGPITHPESPRHAVFTARAIFVGRSLEALIRTSGLRSLVVKDRNLGDWAIGVVRERFWGVPSRWPHLVLMTNFIYWQGETYFIDGSRENGLLSPVLPIVGARINCSRSRPVQDAIIDLRVLRQTPPAGGTRLIGYVRKPEVFTGVFERPSAPNFAADAKIEVTGPTGTKTITTDQTGVYELDGLPPGNYALQLAIPDNQVAGFFEDEGEPVKVHLESDGLVEHNFDLFWNGRIEGHVKEHSGKPAQVSVMLLSADGKQLPGYVNFFLQTNRDGFYQARKIPPGRYIVVINPNGPDDERPYGIQYYPSALRAQDARVLELGPGQQIEGIDFAVSRLVEHVVQVRVTGPNGSAAENAPVCVAYEHTKEYEPLAGINCLKSSDQNGMAIIHLYGNTRVRLFAEQYAYQEKLQVRHRSQTIESDANKTPDTIDLVLNSETKYPFPR